MSPARTTVEILAPGPLMTVQDLGRHGHAHLGVPTSGAADEAAFRIANRLVGNSEDAACLETTLGGAAVLFHGAASVAITGAPTPAWLDQRPVAFAERLYVKPGQTLQLGRPDYGLRTYLGVSGGIDVPPILGSRSTDTLSGLGPEPLTPGVELPIGTDPRGLVGCPDVVFSAVPSTLDPTVRIHAGPREDWFAPDALQTLTSASWAVTAETNRVGARLSGPLLDHSASAQLPSEGMVRGAIEVPPSGQPIVFLADHPTTGGYPVIAVVHAADLGLLAQARPGTRLRFAIARQPSAGQS
ncbi:biotin-dependent carboxyltransferase family protein [Saccharopolyspora spinosa]|uniref:Biotin-dependent carboxylase-like uncharacterized protein n=1 Tax=Saccharopolyspora spinosa TaxID=60894 RepID=A0A2N3Y100_SACSN|nr:biotin-dependent carboxyltransferase family protein [Saccharopolyspora spinosa]PKW16592.1 biotin-dependent carboxylase-like uncharacterized protein [Saccharopolyspora spinosa]